MKNYFKVNSVEVITGQKNDLLKINFICSNGHPCVAVYKFKDEDRHQERFNDWLKHNSTKLLMYNIKNKWSNRFIKCRYRIDGMTGQPMIDELPTEVPLF